MADAPRWGEGAGGPPTREQLGELAKREFERPRKPREPMVLVSPDQFRAYVEAGVIDEWGRFILDAPLDSNRR